MRVKTLLISMLLAFLLVAGCSDGRRAGAGDPGGRGAADGSAGDARSTADRTASDPFAEDASCGSSSIETVRVPGSLLLVFDRSGSMDSSPDRDQSSLEPSKWESATRAIRNVIASVPDELGMGLLFFPSSGTVGEGCTLNGTPEVPVAPLSTSRSEIEAALTSARPGGGTPIVDAVHAAWRHLDALDRPGQRGVIVVTDGGENCNFEGRDPLLSEAAMRHDQANYVAYAVGLTQADNFLSKLAISGGTRISDDCLGECTMPLCMSTGDCPGGNECRQPVAGATGFCSCMSDADCPEPLMCRNIPILGSQCMGEANCCHYYAKAGSFESDFESALSEIARRFLDTCVFEVPRDDIEGFDPNLVNVGVTTEGEERMVLPRSSNASVDSWNYTDSSQESLIIQGPLCERIRSTPATVEIVVGCPTILI